MPMYLVSNTMFRICLRIDVWRWISFRWNNQSCGWNRFRFFFLSRLSWSNLGMEFLTHIAFFFLPQWIENNSHMTIDFDPIGYPILLDYHASFWRYEVILLTFPLPRYLPILCWLLSPVCFILMQTIHLVRLSLQRPIRDSPLVPAGNLFSIALKNFHIIHVDLVGLIKLYFLSTNFRINCAVRINIVNDPIMFAVLLLRMIPVNTSALSISFLSSSLNTSIASNPATCVERWVRFRFRNQKHHPWRCYFYWTDTWDVIDNLMVGEHCMCDATHSPRISTSFVKNLSNIDWIPWLKPDGTSELFSLIMYNSQA